MSTPADSGDPPPAESHLTDTALAGAPAPEDTQEEVAQIEERKENSEPERSLPGAKEIQTALDDGVEKPPEEDQNPPTKEDLSESQIAIPQSNQGDSALSSAVEPSEPIVSDIKVETGDAQAMSPPLPTEDLNSTSELASHMASASVPLLQPIDISNATFSPETDVYVKPELANGMILMGDPNTDLALSGEIDMAAFKPHDAMTAIPDDMAVGDQMPQDKKSGFAKLIFEDGEYFMRTYNIEIGRDTNAWRAEMRRDKRARKHAEKASRKPTTKEDPKTPKRRASDVASQSYISECGGIVGYDEAQIRRMKSERSYSPSSWSHYLSHPGSFSQADTWTDYQTLALQSLPQEATLNPSDVSPQHPDPWQCPILPIHPPKILRGTRSGWKGISRRHAKIAYNFDENCFELHVLGMNGAFVDGEHHPRGETVPLHHKTDIQIGGVSITFILPEMPMTDDEGDARSHRSSSESYSGKMSFSFENGRGESIVMEDDSDSSSERALSLHQISQWELENGYGSDDLVDNNTPSEEEEEEEEDEDGDEDEDEEEAAPPKKQTMRLKMRLKAPNKKSGRQTKLSLKMKKGKQRQHSHAAAKADTRHYRKGHSREASKQIPKEREKAKEERSKAKEAKEEKAKVRSPTMERADNDPTESVEHSLATSAALKTDLSSELKAIVATDPVNGRQLPPEEAARLGIDPNTLFTRKKGPGRPPKDGIMSKREKAIFVRQKKEAEKAIKMGLDPSKLPPIETKIKATPRPRTQSDAAAGDGDADGSKEPGSAQNEGDKKAVKPARPPRSPSPEMKESDYTEEQLQRPAANYVVLIHEAICNHPNKAMTLQQIYSAIERRYPYYKFRTSTTGWQSSVRHNLGGNSAFVKKEKDGKGWVWSVNPDVSIEKDRGKKRAPTPPQHPPHQHGQYPYYHPSLPGYGPPGSVPPNGGYRGPQGYPPGPPQFGAPPRPPVPGVRLPSSLKDGSQSSAAGPAQPTYASPYRSPYDNSGTGQTAQNAGQAGPPRPPYSPYPPGPPQQQQGSHQPCPGPLRETRTPPTNPPRPTHTTPSAPPSHGSHPPESAGTATNSATPPPLTPELNSTLQTFRKTYIENFSKAGDSGKAEADVTEAINRIFHPEKCPTTPMATGVARLVESLWTLIRNHIYRRPPFSHQPPPAPRPGDMAHGQTPGGVTANRPSSVASTNRTLNQTTPSTAVPPPPQQPATQNSPSALPSQKPQSQASESLSKTSSTQPAALQQPKPQSVSSSTTAAAPLAESKTGSAGDPAKEESPRSPTPPDVEPLTPPAPRVSTPGMNGTTPKRTRSSTASAVDSKLEESKKRPLDGEVGKSEPQSKKSKVGEKKSSK